MSETRPLVQAAACTERTSEEDGEDNGETRPLVPTATPRQTSGDWHGDGHTISEANTPRPIPQTEEDVPDGYQEGCKAVDAYVGSMYVIGPLMIGPDWFGVLFTYAVTIGTCASYLSLTFWHQDIELRFVSVLLVMLTWGAMFGATLTDPGIQYSVRPDPEVGRVRWCTTCKVHQNAGTKHCRDCGVCIEGYDHHCPWMGKCVGRGNLRYFYLYLAMVFITLIYMLTTWQMQLFRNANGGNS